VSDDIESSSSRQSIIFDIFVARATLESSTASAPWLVILRSGDVVIGRTTIDDQNHNEFNRLVEHRIEVLYEKRDVLCLSMLAASFVKKDQGNNRRYLSSH
jgi:hypothetical protein